MDTNIALAREIIQEEATKHPLQIDRRTPEEIEQGVPEIMVRVLGLHEYYIHIRAYIWATNTADAFIIGCDLLEQLKLRFEEAGIRMPVPRQYWYNV